MALTNTPQLSHGRCRQHPGALPRLPLAPPRAHAALPRGAGYLETHLALAHEGHDDGRGVPPYVGEFRRYLECGGAHPGSGPGQALWAALLARIYEILPLRCARCGGEMRIIAFVIDVPALTTILAHLGQPTAAPEVAPAPPLWEQPAQPHWDHTPVPAPEYVFEQRVSW